MNSTVENMSNTGTEEKPNRKPTLLVESCPICEGGKSTELLAAPDRFHWRKEMYRLSRCGSCGIVWLVNPPEPAEMSIHYSEDYHNAIVAAGEGSATARWKDQRRLISRYKPGGTLLDIGCSSGGFLTTMKSSAWELYGIEMEESTAERARAATGAKVFVGDAVDAPFLLGTFDVITCFDVLEHVYNPREFLLKVLEWLKPDGIFYAMLPNIDSWEARFFGTYWYGLELPRHLSHFSPRSLRHILTELGFEEVYFATPRVSYVERSVEYVCSNIIEKMGFSPTPQAKPKTRSFAWRAVRKGIRVGVLTPLAQLASLARAGPSMEVAFRKGHHKSELP
jgi:SAM-dependent methyltransferase